MAVAWAKAGARPEARIPAIPPAAAAAAPAPESWRSLLRSMRAMILPPGIRNAFCFGRRCLDPSAVRHKPDRSSCATGAGKSRGSDVDLDQLPANYRTLADRRSPSVFLRAWPREPRRPNELRTKRG